MLTRKSDHRLDPSTHVIAGYNWKDSADEVQSEGIKQTELAAAAARKNPTFGKN